MPVFLVILSFTLIFLTNARAGNQRCSCPEKYRHQGALLVPILLLEVVAVAAKVKGPRLPVEL